MAKIVPTVGSAHGRIDPEQVRSFSDVDDEAALRIVVQDAETTESWLKANFWTLRWRECDALYQSPPGIAVWEGTTVPRANVTKFTVATHLNSITPQLMNGLFYEDPPFLLRSRSPNTSQDTVRAISTVESVQLDEGNFKGEAELGIFSALNFGTGIWKWGWRSRVIKERLYVRRARPASIPSSVQGVRPIIVHSEDSDTFEIKEIERVIEEPFLEERDIRYTLVDPKCNKPDIRKAGFVIDVMYLNYRQLCDLADETYFDADGVERKRYNLPSEEEIREWFMPPREAPAQPANTETYNLNTNFVHHASPRFAKTTEDPLDEPLQVLERWDEGKVLTVLQKCRTIRNEGNEFGCVPYFSVNWWDIPDAFWGMGLGRTIGQFQRIEQGLTNAGLDLASLVVAPQTLRAKGSNAPTQQIRQRVGGIIDVDLPPSGRLEDALRVMEQPRIPPEIFAMIDKAEADAQTISGAAEQLVIGGMGGPKSSMGRTATGAGALASATQNRLGGFVERFVRQVYEPWLHKMHELNCQKLPLGQLRDMLGNELGPAFKIDEQSYLNSRVKFEVLAGAHLAAKQQMAQSLMIMMQIFENPPLMQQLQEIDDSYIDIGELFHMIHDMSGFKNYYNIVRKMTAAQKQKQLATNPNVLKAQAAQAQQGQKFKNDQAIIDQETEGRIARDVIRQSMEKSMEPEAVTGEPGATGFGASEAA